MKNKILNLPFKKLTSLFTAIIFFCNIIAPLPAMASPSDKERLKRENQEKRFKKLPKETKLKILVLDGKKYTNFLSYIRAEHPKDMPYVDFVLKNQDDSNQAATVSELLLKIFPSLQNMTDDEWEKLIPTDEQIRNIYEKNRKEALKAMKSRTRGYRNVHLLEANSYAYIGRDEVIKGNKLFSEKGNLHKFDTLQVLTEIYDEMAQLEKSPKFDRGIFSPQEKAQKKFTDVLLNVRIWEPYTKGILIPPTLADPHLFWVYSEINKLINIRRLREESRILKERLQFTDHNCSNAQTSFENYLTYKRNNNKYGALEALADVEEYWMYCGQKGEIPEDLSLKETLFLNEVRPFLPPAENYIWETLAYAANVSFQPLKTLINVEKTLLSKDSIPNADIEAYLNAEGSLVAQQLRSMFSNETDWTMFKQNVLLAGLTPEYFMELGQKNQQTFKKRVVEHFTSLVKIYSNEVENPRKIIEDPSSKNIYKVGKNTVKAYLTYISNLIAFSDYVSPSYYLSGEAFDTAEKKAERYALHFFTDRIRQIASEILIFQRAMLTDGYKSLGTVMLNGWVPLLADEQVCGSPTYTDVKAKSDICLDLSWAMEEFFPSRGNKGINISKVFETEHIAKHKGENGGYNLSAAEHIKAQRERLGVEKFDEMATQAFWMLVDSVFDIGIPLGALAHVVKSSAKYTRFVRKAKVIVGRMGKADNVVPVVNKADDAWRGVDNTGDALRATGNADNAVPVVNKADNATRVGNSTENAAGGGDKATSAADEVAESADAGKTKNKSKKKKSKENESKEDGPKAWTEGKAFGDSKQGMAAVIKKLKEKDMTPEELGKFFKDKKNQKLFNSLFKDDASRKIAKSMKNEELGKMIKKETTPFMQSSVASGMADEVNYVSLTLEKVAKKGGSRIICKSHIEINLNRILPDGLELTGGLGKKARRFKLKEGLRADELKKAIDSAEKGQDGTWTISFGKEKTKIRRPEYERLKEMAEGKSPIYIELGKNPEGAMNAVRDDIRKIISENLASKSGGLKYDVLVIDNRLGDHEVWAETTYQFFDIEKTRHYHFEYEVRYQVDGVEYHSIYNVEIPISIKDSKLPKANIGKQRFSLFENDAYNELLK